SPLTPDHWLLPPVLNANTTLLHRYSFRSKIVASPPPLGNFGQRRRYSVRQSPRGGMPPRCPYQFAIGAMRFSPRSPKRSLCSSPPSQRLLGSSSFSRSAGSSPRSLQKVRAHFFAASASTTCRSGLGLRASFTTPACTLTLQGSSRISPNGSSGSS